MSRLASIQPEAATGETAELFAAIKKSIGRVPNSFAMMGTHAPAALAAILAADRVLFKGSLPRADQETVKLIVSELGGCDYCVAGHSVVGKMAGLTPDIMRKIRAGDPTGDARRDALVRFVRVLIKTSGTVDAAEVDLVRNAGYTERQLIEIALAIATITFTNLANRINDTVIDFPAVE
ncbi:peroxidase-related enzyme [Paraburkholderia jirisanensis]